MADSKFNLEDYIRTVPDFPKPGIMFRDITPALKNPEALSHIISLLTKDLGKRRIDAIAAVESRGFIFGSPLALALKIPFIPLRKPGKLPAETISVAYALEYGECLLEVHVDAIEKGQRVCIIDDLLATGGTAKASATLIEKLGGVVDSLNFIIELSALGGRDVLRNFEVQSILKY